MPIEIEKIEYKCQHCSDISTTLKECEKHESECHLNPVVINAERLQNNFQKSVEEIRLTSITIPEVIERTIKLLDDNGIELKLTSYPSHFGEKISNSHICPLDGVTNWCNRDKTKPSSYPGWDGVWEGTIKYKNNEKRICFDEIYKCGTNNRRKINFNINYINAPGGNFGEKFSMNGALWLQDFPLIYKEWQENNGEFNLLKKEYSDNVGKFSKHYIKILNSLIQEHPVSRDIITMMDKLESLNIKLKKELDILKSNIKYEFNNSYPFNFPKMTTAFIDLNHYESIKKMIQINEEDKHNLNDIEKHLLKYNNEIQQIHTQIYTYNEYIKNYPERLY